MSYDIWLFVIGIIILLIMGAFSLLWEYIALSWLALFFFFLCFILSFALEDRARVQYANNVFGKDFEVSDFGGDSELIKDYYEMALPKNRKENTEVSQEVEMFMRRKQ